jgi:hypothetical protein
MTKEHPQKEEASALLAPVPYMHLESGLEVCRLKGSVIFGSDRWGLFDQRGVEPGAPVYLYESLLGHAHRPEVTWRAEYVRMYRHEDLGPEERKRRPPTTDNEKEAPFVVYWEVRELRRLEPEEVFPISDLSGEDGHVLSYAFVPHGPLAVAG